MIDKRERNLDFTLWLNLSPINLLLSIRAETSLAWQYYSSLHVNVFEDLRISRIRPAIEGQRGFSRRSLALLR